MFRTREISFLPVLSLFLSFLSSLCAYLHCRRTGLTPQIFSFCHLLLDAQCMMSSSSFVFSAKRLARDTNQFPPLTSTLIRDVEWTPLTLDDTQNEQGNDFNNSCSLSTYKQCRRLRRLVGVLPWTVQTPSLIDFCSADIGCNFTAMFQRNHSRLN